MLLLSPSPRPGGRDHVENARSGIHRGFTAVSFAGSGGAVRLDAFAPVRVTAAVEDDAERVALQLVERPHPRPVRGARPRRAGRPGIADYDAKAL
jgi:hypothetical protein